MPLRDIAVTLVVFGSLFYIFWRPYIGALMWAWLGFMNPHRLTWGFAYYMPFAQIVGLVTLAAMVFSKEPKRIPYYPILIVWGLFILWMNITTVLSFSPQGALSEWQRTMTIQFFTFVTIILINTKDKLLWYVGVSAASLAFFGVKGGLFVLATGGNFMVMGPPGTFIGGNNSVALALIMTIPLLRFFQLQSTDKRVRWALGAAMALCLLSVMASYSRGSVVALAVMMSYLIMKSRKRSMLFAALLILLPLALAFMPDRWYSRQETIAEYEEDESLQGRFNAWWFAYHLANDRPLIGGGFGSFNRVLFFEYAPDPQDFHDAHSIYFEVLGEHGYIGLLLFLGLAIAGMRLATSIIARTRERPDLKWAGDLAAMVKVAGIGYAANGVFLGLAYFDFYYALLAILVITRDLVDRTPVEQAPAAAEPTGGGSIFARHRSGPAPTTGQQHPQ